TAAAVEVTVRFTLSGQNHPGEIVEKLMLFVRRYTMMCSLSVHHLFRTLRILLCATLFALLGSGHPWAQSRPKVLGVGIEHPASAIYIGNSFFYYNNGMSGHVARLLAAADPQYKFRSTLVTIGGSGFDWHDVDSYFRPNAVGSYSFDAKNNIVFNKLDRL